VGSRELSIMCVNGGGEISLCPNIQVGAEVNVMKKKEQEEEDRQKPLNKDNRKGLFLNQAGSLRLEGEAFFVVMFGASAGMKESDSQRRVSEYCALELCVHGGQRWWELQNLDRFL
jgi:hypothetical protein